MFLVIRNLGFCDEIWGNLERDKPSFDLFIKKVKILSGWSLSYPKSKDTSLFFKSCPVLSRFLV